MIYTLIFWMAGCVFEKCPIEAYEVLYYDNVEQCIEMRDLVRRIPRRVAECLPGEIPKWEHLPMWDREA